MRNWRLISPAAPEDWAQRRVLVVVAHPDDEVLGCGALLGTLRDVRVVHVTDGAPRDGGDAARRGFAQPADYAQARRAEALAALSLAGVPAERLLCLGVADQAAATDMAGIARRLAPLLAEADLVLTHTFEGGHGDHDAVAFAVHAAHRLGGASCALVEMPFYHGDATGWVRQRFLPTNGDDVSAPILLGGPLSPEDRALKARMIAAHASQGETLAGFALDAEVFRPAPPYDFTRRPHAGPLLYERHGWNLTWQAWLDAVHAAQSALGVDVR